jgi:hypothetical protein
VERQAADRSLRSGIRRLKIRVVQIGALSDSRTRLVRKRANLHYNSAFCGDIGNASPIKTVTYDKHHFGTLNATGQVTGPAIAGRFYA